MMVRNCPEISEYKQRKQTKPLWELKYQYGIVTHILYVLQKAVLVRIAFPNSGDVMTLNVVMKIVNCINRMN